MCNKKIFSAIILMIFLSSCSSTPSLTPEQKKSMALIKWRLIALVPGHRGLVIKTIDGVRLSSFDQHKIVKPGTYSVTYTCYRRYNPNESVIDGYTFGKGASQITVKAGQTYLYQGKGTGGECVLKLATKETTL